MNRVDLVREKVSSFSVADILYQQSRSNPEKVAVISHSMSYTYDSLYKFVCHFSKKIKAMNVESKNVGIMIPRSLNYIVSYFALAVLGKVIVPIDPDLTVAEVKGTLEYCDIDTVICNQHAYPKLKEIEGINSIVVSEGDYHIRQDFINDDYFHSDKKVNYDDTYLMLHTSGSTFAPKRVMLSHKNVIENAKAHALHMDLTGEDRVLIALPMHFGYCNTAQMITHFLLGGTVILLDGLFSPQRFYSFIETYKVTVFTAVPTMLMQLLDYDHSDKYDFSSLRQITFGGAPMPSVIIGELRKKLRSVKFCQTYGLTEAGPRISAVRPSESGIDDQSVGTAIPGVKIKIVNENYEEVPSFSIGEIIVQSPGVMNGYYKRIEETNQAIANGYLHTGDLGYMNDSGDLFIVGRIKNIIIRGGINIYPEEIESYFLQHAAVKEIIVYGKENRELGETVHAKIVKKDASLTVEELISFAKKGLAKYKIPAIEFVDSLPYTYNKKIKRNWQSDNKPPSLEV